MASTPKQEKHGAYKLIRIAKWVIYPLLALNVWLYLDDEIVRVLQTNMLGSSIFGWIIEFTSSIETLAFLILIVMLELETHVISREDWKGWTARTNRLVRGVCSVLVVIAFSAYVSSLSEYYTDAGQSEIRSLCELADQDVSFVYNLEYTAIDSGNCEALSEETDFFYLGDPTVVTTSSGVTLERLLGWMDAIDALGWLLILASVEIVIRLQKKQEFTGKRIAVAYRVKAVLYTGLFLLGAMWAFLSHWFYAWDAVIWLASFLLIEMNVNRQRDEVSGVVGT